MLEWGRDSMTQLMSAKHNKCNGKVFPSHEIVMLWVCHI